MSTTNENGTTAAGDLEPETQLSYQEAFAHIADRQKRADYSGAADLARSVARQLPDDFDAQMAAGQCTLVAGEAQESLLYASRAISLRDNSAAALFLKSRAEETLNQTRLAFDSINQALSIDPDNTEYMLARGSIFMGIGERENAIAEFLGILKINKRAVGALLKLSVIPGYKLSREQVKMAEFLISSGQLALEQRAVAHFSVARAYEQETKRDRQFKHLHAGNGIYNQLYNYTPEDFSDKVSLMVEHFPVELFAERLSASVSSARLIFIVGMPRSGSTLLEQILCSHSQVTTISENNYLGNAITEFEQNFRFPDIDERSLDALPQVAEKYLQCLGPLTDNSVIVDKTLLNYMFSGVIRLLFPNARFIYTQRNPVATCYGAYKQLFSPGNVPFTYNLDYLAARYRDTVRMVRHWVRVIPDSYFVLDYESLVENQEQITRDLLNFCELPWEDSCLNFHENESAVGTASRMQVKQKIYSSAVAEWKQYADYVEPLTQLLTEEDGYPIES
jgi:tetratricopeptide (TPR) repeat protein